MESGRDESERKEGRTQDPGRRRKREKGKKRIMTESKKAYIESKSGLIKR